MTRVSLKRPLEFFKAKESALEHTLPEGKFYALRLDGKAFHTFTKIFKAPYDFKFMDAMDKSALFVLNNVIPNALFGYVQSDEMSIVFGGKTKANVGPQLVYGGRQEKLISVAASAATGGFMKALETPTVPMFDARLLVLENLEEVHDYVTWRRLDARKNAVSMAAEQLKSHKELQGVSTRERIELLQGTEFEKLPEGFMNGRLLLKVEKEAAHHDFPAAAPDFVRGSFVRSVWESTPAERGVTDELFENLKNSLIL